MDTVDPSSGRLADLHFRQGRLLTEVAVLGLEQQQERLVSTLVQEVTRSGQIEGETLDPLQVRSSLARRFKFLELLLGGQFQGKLRTANYASLTKVSPATAQRDLQELVEGGYLVSVGAGRSTAL